LAFLLAALLATTPSALAGSPDKPDVSDPPGDVKLWIADVPDVPYRDEIDITGVWLSRVNADLMEIHLRVLDISGVAKDQPSPSDSRSRVDWTIEFEAGTGPVSVRAQYTETGWTFQYQDAKYQRAAAQARVDAAGNQIVWVAPTQNWTASGLPLNVTEFNVQTSVAWPTYMVDSVDATGAFYAEPLQGKGNSTAPRPNPPSAKSPAFAAPLALVALMWIGTRRLRPR
jgi:hypothetical protein